MERLVLASYCGKSLSKDTYNKDCYMKYAQKMLTNKGLYLLNIAKKSEENRNFYSFFAFSNFFGEKVKKTSLKVYF